jgi:cullin-associated NEDD8-dissociated protein 1
MDDNDLHIRQVALTALVSALHNKPHLVIPHLGRLLPLLYRETVERQDLIRLVPMGPFKHKVDDGLDLRKSAYETIYTLASTITGEQLHSFGTAEQLVERVLAGLSDDHDIKVLSCLIIGKLASLDISVLTSGGTLDLIITKFSALLAVVVKENAIKQEFEKQSETVRNVHRSSSQIDAAIQSAIATNQSIPLSDVELGNWTKYYTKTLADSKLLPK